MRDTLSEVNVRCKGPEFERTGKDMSQRSIHLTSEPACSEGLTLSGVEAF
ncbi:hypothetical protein HanRHA438_Chr11g0530411 [Helianthus annuus]|nr:hypothetical protein HanRHA438_Chr11g0530411 [Helianthus annuus]